jgi:hypothetical protein
MNVTATYECYGTCHRKGMTLMELMAAPGAHSCPYCTGTVRNEHTGKTRREEIEDLRPKKFRGIDDE